jgi:predicted regulator of Ras-like GTPase activity (Roadblock/LC7/MglB family)
MSEVLRQLGELPGVVGSLVATFDGVLHEVNFPSVFEREALEGLAGTLARDQHLPEWVSGEDAGLELRFPDGRVLVRPTERAFVVVLCTAEVNVQLMNLALTQVVRRIERELPLQGAGDRASRLGPSFTPIPTPTPTPIPSPSPSVGGAPSGGAIEAMVELLQAALGDRAGPSLTRLHEARGDRDSLRAAVVDIAPLVREAIGPERASQVQHLLTALVDHDQPVLELT